MEKQTAVEWLLNNLLSTALLRLTKDEHHLYKELKEQAKAMEREQIIKAFCEGYDHDGDNYDGAEISYYNRTYKGGDK
jgi:hypothetical protein